MSNTIPSKLIEKKIYLIRGLKVILDRDLAELYEVPTKRLNEQVKRNKNSPGLDHIGFLVDDINFICDRLKTSGAEFIIQVPAEFFKVLDPDGVVIDIASAERGW